MRQYIVGGGGGGGVGVVNKEFGGGVVNKEFKKVTDSHIFS